MSVSGVSGSSGAYLELQQALAAQQLASQQTATARTGAQNPPGTQNASPVKVDGHHGGSSQSATSPSVAGAGPGFQAANGPTWLNTVA
jgi:hypothetical protein